MDKQIKNGDVILARFRERKVSADENNSPVSVQYVTIEGIHELKILNVGRDTDGKIYYKVLDVNLDIISWFEEWELLAISIVLDEKTD